MFMTSDRMLFDKLGKRVAPNLDLEKGAIRSRLLKSITKAEREALTDKQLTERINAIQEEEKDIKQARLTITDTRKRLAPDFPVCETCRKDGNGLPRVPAIIVTMDQGKVDGWHSIDVNLPTQQELDALSEAFTFRKHKDCTCPLSHLIVDECIFHIFCKNWYDNTKPHPEQMYRYSRIFLPKKLDTFVAHPQNLDHRICVIDYTVLFNQHVDAFNAAHQEDKNMQRLLDDTSSHDAAKQIRAANTLATYYSKGFTFPETRYIVRPNAKLARQYAEFATVGVYHMV